jgi:hypothetical protein
MKIYHAFRANVLIEIVSKVILRHVNPWIPNGTSENNV